MSASTVSPNATNLKSTESNLTPYHQQPFDFSQPASNFGYPFIAPEALIPFGPYDPSSLTTTSANGTGANGTSNSGDMNLTLLDSASSQEQREHEERLGKEWETTEVMEDNVNGLHSRIHSLAQALGLDAALLDNDLGSRTAGGENDDEKDDAMNELQMGLQGQQSSTAATATGTSEPLPSSSSPTTTAPTADFDFDFFFNNIGSSTITGTDLDSGMDYTSTTFLDEVPTPASSSNQTASPVLSLKQDVAPEVSGVGGSGNTFSAAAAGGGGGGGPAKGTRKRKSEVAMDLDIQETAPLTTPVTKTTTGGNKSKRRKEK